MDLSKLSFGNFTLYTIEAGHFRLDGGAMFGVVPKTLWSRQIAADEKNRIPMTMRCLLVESHQTGKRYLIDNGAGTKGDEKFQSIYQLDYSEYNLRKSFQYHGFEPADVTDVIFTHLHFDHCGGTTYFDEEGEIRHTFPNASYHVTDTHWETTTHPNAREKASFLKENIEPVRDSGRLNLVKPGHRYEPGFSTLEVNGHTLGQQLPKIEQDGKTIVFGGDLIPTHVHVPMPWVMGYDMYPVKTLEEKERYLRKAALENWYLFLEHDAEEEVIQIGQTDGRFEVERVLSLSEL